MDVRLAPTEAERRHFNWILHRNCEGTEQLRCKTQKAGDSMPSNAEIAKDTLEQFKKIQRYMILAKKENAAETYAELKSDYLSLKALLNVIGVNLIDIDIIKE